MSRTLTVAFLMLFPVLSHADRAAVVTYLKTEPVSLWAWGIERLEDHLMSEVSTWSKGGVDGRLVFNSQESSLTIMLWSKSSLGVFAEDRGTAEKACRAAIGMVRINYGVSAEHVEHRSILGDFFQLRGRSGPADLYSEIHSMTEIDVTWGHTDGSQAVRCHASLVYPKVADYYSEITFDFHPYSEGGGVEP